MRLLPFDEYVASLPRKHMSAGVLLRREDDRILLVEPSYRPNWDIPGGVVYPDEASWRTAVREELGIERSLGLPLVIDHVPADGQMPKGIAWIFDKGRIDDAVVDILALTDPEIVSADLYPPAEITGKVSASLARQLNVAVEAAAKGGGPVLCEDGLPVTGPP